MTVDKHTHDLARPFVVLATQNPIEYEGTYPLPEAQLDRFMVRVSLGYPSPAEESDMLAAARRPRPRARPRAGRRRGRDPGRPGGRRRGARQRGAAPLRRRVLDATRADPRVELGASPRAGLMLFRAAKALAALDGRDHALPDDVQALARVGAHPPPAARPRRPPARTAPPSCATRSSGSRRSDGGAAMARAFGALALGIASALAAPVFDTGSLTCPAWRCCCLAGGALVWVGLAARGAGDRPRAGPADRRGGRPYPLRFERRTPACCPPPGGELLSRCSAGRVPLAGRCRRASCGSTCSFERRGRRVLEPAGVHHPATRSAWSARAVRGRSAGDELLVLPRIEPVTAAGGSGAAGTGSPARRAEPRRRARGAAAVRRRADLDGLRPYREGTPAVADPLAGRGAQRRDAGAPADRRLRLGAAGGPRRQQPAVGGGARRRRARGRVAVRAPGPPRAGCAMLLPGDRRPTTLQADLAGWPALHARLALVGAAAQRPPLARARRAGAVIWVSAASPDPPRATWRARPPARAGWSRRSPATARDTEFAVAGCWRPPHHAQGRGRAPGWPHDAPRAARSRLATSVAVRGCSRARSRRCTGRRSWPRRPSAGSCWPCWS